MRQIVDIDLYSKGYPCPLELVKSSRPTVLDHAKRYV
jgi:hypothetical protein